MFLHSLVYYQFKKKYEEIYYGKFPVLCQHSLTTHKLTCYQESVSTSCWLACMQYLCAQCLPQLVLNFIYFFSFSEQIVSSHKVTTELISS